MPFSIKKYFGLKEAFLLLIGVIIIVIVFSLVDIPKTILILQTTPVKVLVLFLFLRSATHLGANYKWKIFVNKIKKVSFSSLFPIYLAGTTLDNLVPGPGFGAEPVKAYYLSKLVKKDIGKCFATALMDNLVLSVVLFGFLIFSIIYMYLFIELAVIRIAVGALLLLFLLFAVTAIYFYFRKDHRYTTSERILKYIYDFRLFSFIRKRYSTYGHFKTAMHTGISNLRATLGKLWGDKMLMLRSVAFSFVWVLLIYTGHLLLFWAYGVDTPFYAIIAVLTIADMLGYYSFIPAGTGISEGSRIAMLSFIGISPEIAAAATIIDRTVFYIVTYVLGYISLSYVNIKYIKRF